MTMNMTHKLGENFVDKLEEATSRHPQMPFSQFVKEYMFEDNGTELVSVSVDGGSHD